MESRCLRPPIDHGPVGPFAGITFFHTAQGCRQPSAGNWPELRWLARSGPGFLLGASAAPVRTQPSQRDFVAGRVELMQALLESNRGYEWVWVCGCVGVWVCGCGCVCVCVCVCVCLYICVWLYVFLDMSPSLNHLVTSSE